MSSSRGVANGMPEERDITEIRYQDLELHELSKSKVSQGGGSISQAGSGRHHGEVEAEPEDQVSPDGDGVARLGSNQQGGRKQKSKDRENWWNRHVSKRITFDANVRDYFALERTHLSYIRTSQALASLAIALYQLFRISAPSQSLVPSTRQVLGLEKAAALLMICIAMITTLIGCARFLVGQRRLHETKWRSGGWELTGALGGGLALVSLYALLFKIEIMLLIAALMG